MFFSSIKEKNRLRKRNKQVIKYRNVFNSIKEINRLREEINKLLYKGMSGIYLKVTFEEKN